MSLKPSALPLFWIPDSKISTWKSGEDKEESLLAIKRNCLLLNPESSKSTNSSLSDTDNTQSTQAEEPQAPPWKRLKGLAAVLGSINEEEGTSSTQLTLTTDEKIEKEMNTYLDIPLASSDTDPLVWWKTENERFPHLAQLAKKHLCICGTSVPSERIFSTAGNISGDSRCRLLPQNVNKLVFLAKNMKNFFVVDYITIIVIIVIFFVFDNRINII